MKFKKSILLAGTILSLFLVYVFLSYVISYIGSDRGKSLRIGGAGPFKQNMFTSEAEKKIKAVYKKKYTVNSTNTGDGLVGLKKGKYDIIMSAGHLEAVVDLFNRDFDKNGYFNIKLYKVHSVTKVPLVIFVHPDNPVEKLTREQFRGIFSGEIRKWEEILPSYKGDITFVTSSLKGGIRYTIENEADINHFGGNIKVVISSSESKKVVSQDESAISYDAATDEIQDKMTSPNGKYRVKIIPIEGLKILVPLNLVTWKEPTIDQQLFIDAVKKANDITD